MTQQGADEREQRQGEAIRTSVTEWPCDMGRHRPGLNCRADDGDAGRPPASVVAWLSRRMPDLERSARMATSNRRTASGDAPEGLTDLSGRSWKDALKRAG